MYQSIPPATSFNLYLPYTCASTLLPTPPPSPTPPLSPSILENQRKGMNNTSWRAVCLETPTYFRFWSSEGSVSCVILERSKWPVSSFGQLGLFVSSICWYQKLSQAGNFDPFLDNKQKTIQTRRTGTVVTTRNKQKWQMLPCYRTHIPDDLVTFQKILLPFWEYFKYCFFRGFFLNIWECLPQVNVIIL